ncbi:hypothetical protein VE02_06278 [Pseudogymnoascus sp. 03VT05]|nr:hypothetical protein VE02_06278 [Pseudogymnoascus sp. 03VT05]
MERRQKLEISEFIDTFLEGPKPGAGLIGQPDEYLNADGTDLGDAPAQDEGEGDEMGAAYSGPAPNDATSAETGNVDDDNTAGDAADTAGGAAVDDDGDIAMKPADPDSESVGGDGNNTHLSGDFVKLPSGEYVAVWEYFGLNWAAKIADLYNVEPLECPEDMTVVPHAYQLKAAAQADFLCDGPFGGIMIGDGMGLGKTLMAIIAMYLRRNEPGMLLVLCPASLCTQWVETIHKSWS